MQPTANETTVVAIENRVSTLLADHLAGSTSPIVSQKYLTPDNRLITVTLCNVAETAIPRLRVQMFERVDGGVMEHSYALFNDRRFEWTDNPMIFGTTPDPATTPAPVDDAKAEALLATLDNITQSDQHLT